MHTRYKALTRYRGFPRDVAGHRLWGVWAPGLWSMVSIVAAHPGLGLLAGGIFHAQGANACLLRWQADSLPLTHQGSPVFMFFIVFFGAQNFFLSN